MCPARFGAEPGQSDGGGFAGTLGKQIYLTAGHLGRLFCRCTGRWYCDFVDGTTSGGRCLVAGQSAQRHAFSIVGYRQILCRCDGEECRTPLQGVPDRAGLWPLGQYRAEGRLGSKFARALVSEIIGAGATFGVKRQVVLIQQECDQGCRDLRQKIQMNADHDPAFARQENGKSVKLEMEEFRGQPQQYPPTIDDIAGGVTIDYVAYGGPLAAVRRKLSFGGGDIEARTVLAALGLLAVLAAESRGHDLRSRCLLVPKEGKALALKVVQRDGMTENLAIDLNGAIALFNAAVAALPQTLSFRVRPGEPLAMLTPSPKLAALVQRSRELAATGADVEEE